MDMKKRGIPFIVNRGVQRLVDKCTRKKFEFHMMCNCLIKKVKDKLHNNFVVGLKAHLLMHKCVNLGVYIMRPR
jgi:hypothetical protein